MQEDSNVEEIITSQKMQEVSLHDNMSSINSSIEDVASSEWLWSASLLQIAAYCQPHFKI
jgi:hypothetical protein